jgi:hypothetical protein
VPFVILSALAPSPRRHQSELRLCRATTIPAKRNNFVTT